MNILIVEDEALLALELESELESVGHQVVGHAMSSHEARTKIDAERPEFAFVDVHLLDGVTGLDVGRYLAERSIPFVFVTGNVRRLPDDFVGAIGAIEKPYTMNGLENAVNFVERFMRGEVHPKDAPPSLILSRALQESMSA
ncbi:response regulator [Rhizobium paknamense]|uniref:DNA-binding response OmpR family regulator n=1 Tax=Rhizobium paknamense TaxID=1206817 RepID=A0ABU0IBI8_9HYPH|nr:response regulator [Rhizobium paknamense]MDQ0455594.1 DNA-binding response OmpR family regulator [Rhizobium paknamense]